MDGKFLLDRNIVTEILAKNPEFHQKLAGATEVFVSSIVLGELYYGKEVEPDRIESPERRFIPSSQSRVAVRFQYGPAVWPNQESSSRKGPANS